LFSTALLVQRIVAVTGLFIHAALVDESVFVSALNVIPEAAEIPVIDAIGASMSRGTGLYMVWYCQIPCVS
jgi:hypothetical protein